MDSVEEQLIKLGLSDQKVKETMKNKELCSRLCTNVTKAISRAGSISKTAGNLIYHMGTKVKPQIRPREDFILDQVMAGKLSTEAQLNAAVEYFLSNPSVSATAPVDMSAFNEACGIGVVVTPEQIETAVEEVIEKYRAELIAQRYRFNVGRILGEANRKLKWADGKCVKNEVDVQLISLLGARTAEDNAKPTKEKKEKGKQAKPKADQDASPTTNGHVDPPTTELVGPTGEVSFMDIVGEAARFHKPGENYKTDGYQMTETTMAHMRAHLKRTNGIVVTRFPPEPNGILHIGHAKAINFNFGYAKKFGGITYLRYDDTNPEKEEERFFVAILDMVRWLGYEPFKVTHASDHFQQLFDWAVELIRRGQAYVCHQKTEEIKGHNAPPSPWRDRPMRESLRLFEDMRRGKIAEGDATLRMKITLEDGKQDPVAYRIKFVPHHRTGSDWCIYPTYDYTHCLCDSLEDISHSLCTKEFQSRRSSYYWLCNALDVYCPVQWEYGRLNLHYTVVSKRKILRLIQSGVVSDWDDPRLFTLTALRRRGIPPEAINLFVGRGGVTMALTTLHPSMLDAATREVLNNTAPRTMAVLEPLKVSVTNWPADFPSWVEAPDFPSQPERGSRRVAVGSTLFIERSDCRDGPADKNYKRLASDQPVGLRHTGLVIELRGVVARGPDGQPRHIEATCRRVEAGPKPKAFVHWVSSPRACEVRLYELLFDYKNPEEHPDGIMAAVNPNNRRVISDALIDRSVKTDKLYQQYQFERNGYFAVDRDSTPEKPVFNRTVTLREDRGKE